MTGRYFMLTRLGEPLRVSLFVEGVERRKSFPVCANRSDAIRLKRRWELSGVRAEMIDGLAVELFRAARDGCTHAALLTGWAADGSPSWGVVSLEPLKAKQSDTRHAAPRTADVCTVG
jgi:hypothetical protein